MSEGDHRVLLEAVLRFSRWQSTIGLAQSTAQGHTVILPTVFKTEILAIFTIKDPVVLSTTHFNLFGFS